MGHVFPLEEMKNEIFPLEIYLETPPERENINAPEYADHLKELSDHEEDPKSNGTVDGCRSSCWYDSDDKDKIAVEDIISYLTCTEEEEEEGSTV